jgi:fermentation-respiration switch protein FrsA (DUF1100 family)
MAMQFVGVAWRVLAVLVVVYLLLVLIAWIFQRHLIYLPDRSAPAPPPGVEEVHYTTEDGHELTGWFLRAGSDEPYATIVVSSGNAGNRADRLPLAEGLTDRGYSVLLMDYRGYGGNLGSPSEGGLIADHRAAVSYVMNRPDVDPSRLVYFGESLGSAVAAIRSAEQPPAALVLRSPFPELADVGQGHYWFLPVRLLLRDRFRTSEHLDEYDGPTLVLAAEHDTVVPVELSRRVAEAHADRYVEIPGADHNDAAVHSGRMALSAVDDFLRMELARPGPDRR